MKKVIIIVSAFVVILVAAGIIFYPFLKSLGNNDMQKALNLNFSTVDKITIKSDMTGKESTIVGRENLQEFFDVFKGVKLKKSAVLGPSTGYIYGVSLYQSDKIIGGFNFGYNTIVVPATGMNSIEYTSSKNIDDKEIEKIAEKYNLT
jgi:hypothetical protein